MAGEKVGGALAEIRRACPGGGIVGIMAESGEGAGPKAGLKGDHRGLESPAHSPDLRPASR